jgi:hypothetical protein
MLTDETDAAEVERAWVRLMPFDKEVLRYCYIWRARPELICRKLRIKVRPTSILDLAVAHAQREIGKMLSAMEETRTAARQRREHARV